jgi:hypothetical protein
MTWRKRIRPIISKVIAENQGKPEKEVRQALRESYPFGEKTTHHIQDSVESMDFDELFASNEYDFQELALELGECYSCEKTVMDGDFEHSTCPYESDEVHNYCPYYDEVVSYLKEVLVEKLEEEEMLMEEGELKC